MVFAGFALANMPWQIDCRFVVIQTDFRRRLILAEFSGQDPVVPADPDKKGSSSFGVELILIYINSTPNDEEPK